MSKNKFNEKKVTITKVVDEVYNSKHPNGINEGYTATGYIYNFEIGKSATLTRNSREFKTSFIRTINEDAGIFETANSIYTIVLEEDDEKGYDKKECTEDITTTEITEYETDDAVNDEIEIVLDNLLRDADERFVGGGGEVGG